MTIRTRLTLMVMLIMAVILGAVLFFVYRLQAALIADEFDGLLAERAGAIATVVFEPDSAKRLTMLTFERRNMRALPLEHVVVVDEADRTVVQFGAWTDGNLRALIAEARRGTNVMRDSNERQVIAHRYDGPSGDIVVLVSAVDEAGMEQLADLRWIMSGAFLAGLLATLAGGVVVAGRALAPVDRVVRRVQTITASNLHLRVEEADGRDEIARLATTFNEMLERLERSFETQSTFVTNASHELRTPLTTIIGEIHVQLARERTADEYRTSLLSVLHDAERLNAIVNSLLMLAKYEEGRMPLDPEEVRIDDVVIDAISMVQHHPGAQRITLTIDEADDGSSFTVVAHRSLLLVCMSNLLDNALKYSSENPVDVTVHATATMVRVSVHDLGIGIPPDVVLHLAEPFYRASNARGVPGYGIGLAVTKRIVSLYAGTLEVQSQPGAGTTVTISFPLPRTSF